MNTQELIKHLTENDKIALDLLNELNPQLKRRFSRSILSLMNIIDEVRTQYPDALYFVNEDNIALCLGNPSEAKYIQTTQPIKSLVACSSAYNLNGRIGSGQW